MSISNAPLGRAGQMDVPALEKSRVLVKTSHLEVLHLV